MSIYFVDHQPEATRGKVPRLLPLSDQESGADLLDDLNSLRREKQVLSRSIAGCSRALNSEAKDALQNFKCRQDFKLMHSDSCWEYKEKMKATDLKLARAAHLPSHVQESILAEKRSIQENMTTLTESYDKVKKLLDEKIGFQERSIHQLTKTRRTMQNILSDVNEKRQIDCAHVLVKSDESFNEKLETTHEKVKLINFLESEGMGEIYDECIKFGIQSVSTLASWQSIAVQALPMSEHRIVLLLYAIKRAKTLLTFGTVEKVLTKSVYSPLFSHRLAPTPSKLIAYQNMVDAIMRRDLARLYSILKADGKSAINEQNDDGWTPLHRAASLTAGPNMRSLAFSSVVSDTDVENVGLVDLLIEFDAEVGLKNKYGRTALHYAAMEGNLAACMTLINSGAEANEADSYGMHPMQHAKLMKKASWYQVCGLLYLHMPPELDTFRKSSSSRKKRKKKKVTTEDS